MPSFFFINPVALHNFFITSIFKNALVSFSTRIKSESSQAPSNTSSTIRLKRTYATKLSPKTSPLKPKRNSRISIKSEKKNLFGSPPDVVPSGTSTATTSPTTSAHPTGPNLSYPFTPSGLISPVPFSSSSSPSSSAFVPQNSMKGATMATSKMSSTPSTSSTSPTTSLSKLQSEAASLLEAKLKTSDAHPSAPERLSEDILKRFRNFASSSAASTPPPVPPTEFAVPSSTSTSSTTTEHSVYDSVEIQALKQAMIRSANEAGLLDVSADSLLLMQTALEVHMKQVLRQCCATTFAMSGCSEGLEPVQNKRYSPHLASLLSRRNEEKHLILPCDLLVAVQVSPSLLGNRLPVSLERIFLLQ
eukprot:TRINITY_DN1213_c0_g1_i1.p1 TRINITY_DN1213_c0_g1~~TRINITY_DN1213_c0_g1_i1.p1  ORF type:complete len:361 (+),score=83.71 TRINITY_DN1213_c0_g1_i1:301-1383(+)